MGTLQRSRLKWLPLPERGEAKGTTTVGKSAGGVAPLVEELPDLLHPEPHFMIDRDALAAQLAFSFAGGDAADIIRQQLVNLRVAPSEWRPESFAKHLYVDDFVRTACRIEIDGRPLDVDNVSLSALLTHPPADSQVRTFRHTLLAELTDTPETRQQLTELYRRLRALRALFLTTAPPRRPEATRHRMEILAAVRAVIEQAASGFGHTRSGLSRLNVFGQNALSSSAYVHLRDLLEHDRQRASVGLEVRLGGDGRVRGLTIKNLVEAKDSTFYRTPLERLLMRLQLWVRGYGFHSEALLDRWMDDVYAGIEPWLPALFQLQGAIEFYLAALGFRELCQTRGLSVCLPELITEGESRLTALFNPLLLAQGVTPVPCDLVRSGQGTTTIITGPNSGGKTRLLQAIGLSQLLAEVGFFVPAKEARLYSVPLVFCSIVQEDSFDQGEGRLGMELLRIRRLFEEAKPGALVVLDELCSGTNPSEGEEIFVLVISLLRELQPETYVTSHFLDFASRLAENADPLLRFLQVELDTRELPTYAFVPGVARTSLATRAAARLGVTREELLLLVQRHKKAGPV